MYLIIVVLLCSETVKEVEEDAQSTNSRFAHYRDSILLSIEIGDP